MKKLIILIILILWALLIYHFSSQPYKKQDITPQIHETVRGWDLKDKLSWVSFDYGGREISIDNLGVDTFIEFFLRKAAHLTIFFVLGLLTYGLLGFLKRPKLRFWAAIIFVLIYASLDEFHQSLSEDRTPLAADVAVDTIGGMLAVFIAAGIVWRSRKNKKIE